MTLATAAQDTSQQGQRRHDKYDRLVAAAQSVPKLKVAVAHPCDAASLGAVFEAVELGLIEPILVGPQAKIAAAAAALGKDISQDCASSTPRTAMRQRRRRSNSCRSGEAEALMKGSLHTDELMAAVVRREGGLRTARRISHCFVMDVPGHETPLIITDAAVNIAPTLEDKVHIVQNAIDLAHALRVEPVRVAILSAMETVNPKVPSTIEAAALCKMADRGQITGGILDGPLALDNAIDLGAAKIKKIQSPVAGQANVLVVPDLEAGNMLAKSLTFLADADAAGIVLGARVPIILTSRADSTITRLASCAVASLVADAQRSAARRPGGLSHDARPHRPQCRLIEPQVPGLRRAGWHGAARRLQGALRGLGSRRTSSSRTPTEDPRRDDVELRRSDRARGGADAPRLWLRQHQEGRKLAAIGHRVVHGGEAFASPVLIDETVVQTLETLVPLAPLHQPHNLEPIRIVRRLLPGMPQVACFDTAFHQSQSEIARMFALPREMRERGVKRYGFHGLSYDYIASVLKDYDPRLAKGRVVVAHLGNGASLCAP